MTRGLVLVAIAACSAPAEHPTAPPRPPVGSDAAKPPSPPPSTEPLAIALRSSGEIRLADQPVDDATLDGKLREVAARDPNLQVYVQVEQTVARERVERVLARAKAAGLKQIAVTDLPPDTVPGTPPSPIGLVWEMHVEGDQLRIDYTITNTTDHKISAVEAMWRPGGEFDPDGIVVRADTRPDAIAFTRAFVAPGPSFRIEHVDRKQPRYAEVPANGELRGAAHVKLPVGAAHNFSGSYAITGTRTMAVLEIGFFETDAAHAKLLRGKAKPLPKGAQLASPKEQVDRGSNVVLPGG